MRVWIDKVVSVMLLIVYTIIVLYLYTFITPNYVLIRVSHAGEIATYATVYTSGGCNATIDELLAMGPLTDKFVCLQVASFKP